MKNLLLILILIVGSSYYFVPYDTKVELLEKVGIDSSFLPTDEIKQVKGEVIKLKFDDITHKVSFKGNISNGELMEDLSWASSPYVKCFYQDKYNYFEGNTILHKVLLGKKKDIVVKLIPNNENSNLSMYVYKTDALSDVYPPEKEYAHDCLLGLSNSNGVIEMNGNTITSDIVIGIAGSNGIIEGGYNLELEEK